MHKVDTYFFLLNEILDPEKKKMKTVLEIHIFLPSAQHLFPLKRIFSFDFFFRFFLLRRQYWAIKFKLCTFL